MLVTGITLLRYQEDLWFHPLDRKMAISCQAPQIWLADGCGKCLGLNKITHFPATQIWMCFERSRNKIWPGKSLFTLILEIWFFATCAQYFICISLVPAKKNTCLYIYICIFKNIILCKEKNQKKKKGRLHSRPVCTWRFESMKFRSLHQQNWQSRTHHLPAFKMSR